MKIVSTSVMRELERRMSEESGVKGEELMFRAGDGVAQVVNHFALSVGYQAPIVHLIAGRGNNGGDVFVAAAALKAMGCAVEIWLAGTRDQVRGDALTHMNRLKTDKIRVLEMPTVEDWRAAMENPAPCDVIVDGVLGTGLSGPARGPAAAAIKYINAQSTRCFCVSIDVPSGLNAETGRVEGEAVYADLTVTIGLPKRGLLKPSALEYVGHLEVANIGIPEKFVQDVAVDEDEEFIFATDVRSMFSRRKRDSHKGSYGRVLLIGGSRGMSGAILLAARAALRSGVGLVSVLTTEEVGPLLMPVAPEAMVHVGETTPDGALSARVVDVWRRRFDEFDAVLVGPGMGRSNDTLQIVRCLVRECEATMIFDADALSVMSAQVDIFKKARKPPVLTPHPGEMAKLIQREVAEVQANRAEIARRVAGMVGGVVVLKGAGTIVAQTGRPISISLAGNPGMATGGSGDVLAGLLAGVVAQGLDPFDAARAAVYLHGRAGDIAAWEKSQACLIAGDIIDSLPNAFRGVALR